MTISTTTLEWFPDRDCGKNKKNKTMVQKSLKTVLSVLANILAVKSLWQWKDYDSVSNIVMT